MSKSKVQVYQPQMIHKALLSEHPQNSQRQSKHAFNELRKSIRENGFDESLIIVPRDDNMGYYIVSGNHRYRAGVAEGMEEFPCVVRTDWDEVKSRIELVRRNYVRGKIDQDAFTQEVNSLSKEKHLSIEDIMTQMGFASEDEFAKLYMLQKEQEEKAIREIVEREATSNATTVKMVDDLGFIISSILEKYGHTVPYSFLVFPAGGKNHMYISANPSLRKTMEAIATACVQQGLDINVALAGLLRIGLNNTNFLNQAGREQVVETVEQDSDGSPDFDLEIV